MRRILVGLDGSPRAEAVLGAAAALARRSGAKLVLVRAVTLPVELPLEALRMAPDALGGFLLDHERQELERRAKAVADGLVERVHVELGSPWQVICDTAKQSEADLIVVGSHGYGVLDRVLGTTAAKVVNHADRAVLVVRAPERLT